MNTIQTYTDDAVRLVQSLIRIPSVSRDEGRAADLLEQVIRDYGLSPRRIGHNILVDERSDVDSRPVMLLNAHIDTVKPVSSWTRDPFTPTLADDRLYGLGSNDCGGGLVSLLQVYRYFKTHECPYQLVYLASAEEEVSGASGFSLALPHLPKIDVAIVGEPTGMQPAIAEKGLMVLDVTAHGQSGHAARQEGVNAIYEALDDLNWLHRYRFERVSPLLGPTLMNVTVIHAGTQHNVIPDRCEMTVDVRTNELYTNDEVLAFIQSQLHSEVKARSTRLQPSRIDPAHPLVRRCVELGMTPFGSPTLSDQALMPFPSMKLGPGQSSRSHSADEYILVSEIALAIEVYIDLLTAR